MLELPVAPSRDDQSPSIVQEHSNHITNLHFGSLWSCLCHPRWTDSVPPIVLHGDGTKTRRFMSLRAFDASLFVPMRWIMNMKAGAGK